MAWYVVIDNDVTDWARFKEYRQAARPAIEKYGGRVLAVTEQPRPLEGDWRPKGLVLLEFPSRQHFEALWNSTEYAEAKKLRRGAARLNIVLVEGR